MKPAALLFDLDGTLIDSIELILASYRHTLAAHVSLDVADHALRPDLGTPLREVLGRFADDGDEVDAMVDTYRTHNREHHDAMVSAYAGMTRVVEAAAGAGIALGIVTNKSGPPAIRGLEVCGIREHFRVVISADDVENHKPHPEPILEALGRLDVPPANAVFIGDSPHDLTAGAAAGVRTGAALWGPFSRASLEPQSPHWWFERPDDILDVLNLRSG